MSYECCKIVCDTRASDLNEHFYAFKWDVINNPRSFTLLVSLIDFSELSNYVGSLVDTKNCITVPYPEL